MGEAVKRKKTDQKYRTRVCVCERETERPRGGLRRHTSFFVCLRV